MASLTTIVASPGHLLHVRGGRRSGPDDKELMVQLTRADQIDRTAVESHRHTQRQAPGGRGRSRGGPNDAAHLHCGAARLHGVIRASEAKEQRVAAELQQDSAPSEGERKGVAEDTVEDARQLLGALAAPPSQALGKGREARDVHQAESPVQLAPVGTGRVEIPLREQARNVPP